MRCPWNTTHCEACLENMYEWEMQMHKCPLVDGAEQCICYIVLHLLVAPRGQGTNRFAAIKTYFLRAISY